MLDIVERLFGLVLLIGSIGLIWYAKPHPQLGSRFPERYRDLIESYLTVLIVALLACGLCWR